MAKANAGEEDEGRQLPHQILLFICYMDMIHSSTGADVTRQCGGDPRSLQHILTYMRNLAFTYKDLYKDSRKYALHAHRSRDENVSRRRYFCQFCNENANFFLSNESKDDLFSEFSK